MCCPEFIVKYTLFFVNLAFSLAGLALLGLGIAVLHNVSEILELIPVNINVIPITLIVIGCVVFLIAFFGCCGAIREGRCLLIMYAICMIILAAIKTYLAVIIFKNLNNIHETVRGWLVSAFENTNLSGPYHILEITFRCCGTTGAGSYVGVLPSSCCASPINNTCAVNDSYGGCTDILGDYFETFGKAIGSVIIIIIAAELVAMIFALFLSNSIANKNRRHNY